MHKLVPIFLIALLAGCATTPEEREARMQREVNEMIQTYGPTCDKLGYKRESDPWRDCVLTLSTKESYERYSLRPTTSTCFGNYGFFQCTAF
jgi:hypothetical protein